MGAAPDEDGSRTESATSVSASFPEIAAVNPRCELVFRSMSKFMEFTAFKRYVLSHGPGTRLCWNLACF